MYRYRGGVEIDYRRLLLPELTIGDCYYYYYYYYYYMYHYYYYYHYYYHYYYYYP